MCLYLNQTATVEANQEHVTENSTKYTTNGKQNKL